MAVMGSAILLYISEDASAVVVAIAFICCCFGVVAR
jgi:hypothetical protein